MTDASSTVRREIGFRLVLLARRWRQAIDAELAAAGLTDATWRPLIHLHKLGDGVRQKELAASLGMDGSGVVRLLDVLAERGLLERREDPADGRAKSLHLTPDGRRLVARAEGLITVFEEEMLGGLENSDIIALAKTFDRIETSIDAARAGRQDQK